MRINEESIRTLLRQRDSQTTWRIECNSALHSICALGIFTEILRKELVRYEVVFSGLDEESDFLVHVESSVWMCGQGAEDGKEEDGQSAAQAAETAAVRGCTCGNSQLAGPEVMYRLAKQMNFMKETVVWPMAVAYAFALEHSVAPPCRWCLGLKDDIDAQIRTLNCAGDGVLCETAPAQHFLKADTLLEALKADMAFVVRHKIAQRKERGEDSAIFEILARAGISIVDSRNSYVLLNSGLKQRIAETFGERTVFVRRMGHDLEITAVEHALLMLFYLYTGHPLHALLSLRLSKLVDVGRGVRFHHAVGKAFREALAGRRRLRHAIVFQVRSLDLGCPGAGAVVRLLERMFSKYISGTYSEAHVPVVVGAVRHDRSAVAVFSSQLAEGIIKHAAGKERQDGILVVEMKNLGGCLKKLC